MVRGLLPSLLAACALGSVFAASEGSAFAQTRFGDKGQLAITAENLFALSTERRAETAPTGGDNVNVTNRFGILFSDRQDSVSSHGPQVGGHFFVWPSISLGGTIGYESRGGSVTPAPVGGVQLATQSKPDAASFIFMPKIGYALMLTNTLGFWFRGGIGVFRLGVSNADDSRNKDSFTYWLLSGDALFVVTPAQHFGFYVGPQADFSISGSHGVTRVVGGVVTDVSYSASLRDLGIGTGLIGYFDL